MSRFVTLPGEGLSWQLIYTKPNAEAWVEANLRKQGFATLLPWTPAGARLVPLFRRYLFAGYGLRQRAESMAGTYGVSYVVQCGSCPARVPHEVIADVRGRMDAHGVVRVARPSDTASLFAASARHRATLLARFAEAGFRVRAA